MFTARDRGTGDSGGKEVVWEVQEAERLAHHMASGRRDRASVVHLGEPRNAGVSLVPILGPGRDLRGKVDGRAVEGGRVELPRDKEAERRGEEEEEGAHGGGGGRRRRGGGGDGGVEVKEVSRKEGPYKPAG